jgi:ABC-type bacteriocin/lantibiotic exporter with double-glycine peptidase domain
VGEIGQAVYRFETTTIIYLLLTMTGVMLLRAVLSALSAFFLGRFAGKAEYNFRVNFIKFFLRQRFSKFEKTNSGESLSVFANDLPQAVKLVAGGSMQLISDLMLLISVLAFMMYLNRLYTIIFIALFPVLAIFQALVSIPVQKVASKTMETKAGFNAVVNDSLQNTATVIAYALEDELEHRYVSAYKEYFSARMTYIRRFSVLILAGFVVSTFPLAFLFIASGFAVVNETMLISEFIVYTGIGILAVGWLADLAQLLGNMGVSIAGAKRLVEANDGDCENIGYIKNLDSSEKAVVAFENVSFAYAEDSHDVLDGTSFEILHGAKVAIVGGSGSGKSTILKLLLGLYEPKVGKIKVFGNDIATIDKSSLRNIFSYVPQDSFLFPVSITENITGKKEISKHEEERLEKSCRDAGIYDFIKSLPNGYNSMLSESAENISGGQRQRIALARAFYKDAPIILFDEATSALDPSTEAEILFTLQEATIKKTVIMVAHRAAAKSFCDTIITLDGGK